MMQSLSVPNSIRNRVKKLRENLRKALRAALPSVSQIPDSKQSKKSGNMAMEKILNCDLPTQAWQEKEPAKAPVESKGDTPQKDGNNDGAAGAGSKKKKA